MKGRKIARVLSTLIGLFALFASGHVSAATFTISDDIQLENVSAARTIETRNLFQVNFAARVPEFLNPLKVLEDAKEAPENLHEIKHWVSEKETVLFRLLERNDRYTDVDDPRLRWVKVDDAQTDISFPTFETPSELTAFRVSENLTWAEQPDQRRNVESFSTFVVKSSDSTCGFPNDFFNLSLSASELGGINWVKTASFEPNELGGPATPRISGVTWLTMPMPHVVGYGIGTKDHAKPPISTELRFGDADRDMTHMTVGFKEPRDIFRCRVYASGQDTSFTPPDYVSPFNQTALPDFGSPFFPLTPAAVPLPAGSILLATGILGMFFGRRKRATQQLEPQH